MSWLQTAPLPVIGLVVLALLFAGVEVGYRGKRWRLNRNKQPDGHGAQDHLLSAVLGLLALLLGFTFSLALNRYDARRELVVQEANAIGTTWLRVQLLEEPSRTTLSALMRRYIDARMAWSDTDNAADSLSPTSQIQARMWQAMGTAVRSDSSQLLSRATMDAMNESFDRASDRQAARAAHVPNQVLEVLLLFTVLSMVLLGDILAVRGRPHRFETGLLLVLMTLSIVVILDLDRPLNGAITVSQQPLVELKASLR